MKKVKLEIKTLIMAHGALLKIMHLQGIERKKAYWLERNLKIVHQIILNWQKITMPIVMKYAETLPETKFVPVTKYNDFKNEIISLCETLNPEISLDNMVATGVAIKEVFDKYEIFIQRPEGQDIGIPIEKREAYKTELEAFEKEHGEHEIEFYEIVADKRLDQILVPLTVEEQVSLEWMFEEPSNIRMVNPDGVIIQ